VAQENTPFYSRDLQESIQVIAQTIGISKLKEEIAQALASDVEYRIREIIQDAAKFMKHSKRTQLTTQDVNNALSQKNVEVRHRLLY
jgi:transcription initiation factor TFIID subunit 6